MALKATIDSLDSVDASLHDFYDERDGKFVLRVEGIEQHPSAVALKAALDRVRAEKRTVTDKLTAAESKLADVPDDFDAEEWVRLKAEAPDPNDPDRKKPSDEHLQSQKRVYEQRIANMERKHADEIKARDEQLAGKDGFIGKLLVDDGLTKALIEAGVGKEYLKAAKAMLKDSVKILHEDGTYRAVVETDMGEDDVGKFVQNWSQSDEGKVFVSKPTGGDAKGGNGRSLGENPFDTKGGTVRPNLTKQQELIAANPEKARQLAKAAGATVNW